MTAHDTNLPNTSAGPDATTGAGVTSVSRDNAAVIVWPNTTGAADTPDAGGSPLTSRRARHLVAIYSDVHGTVIDYDTDVTLHHAAETTGRRYLPVTNPAGPTASADQPQPATLIMLRWPRPAATAPRHDANRPLGTCQQHLADDGIIITAATAGAAGAAGTSYDKHEDTLPSAAPAAGPRRLHDTVPLDADGRDVFTYPTIRDTAAANHDSDSDTPPQITSTTLMIFGHPESRP
jgi:hypothetical protein